MTYKAIHSPIDYGGLKLKNRIIFAPTTFELPEEEYFAKIGEIASGGCAMIIVGDVPVDQSPFQRSLFDSKGFAYYERLAQLVHQKGCRLCAQLHQSDSDLKVMAELMPQLGSGRISGQEMREAMNRAVGPYISTMPADQVRRITSAFGEAALLAVKAGFDMVQVHGDRMCGSFSSGVYNRRADQYGGSLQNRARFAVEAVEAVREKLPQIPIDFKLAVRQENPHYGNAGVLESELEVFVPLLEQAGVTSFHVTLANHSRLEDTIPPANHPEFGSEGCFLKFCDQVRKYTRLPICGVGGLTDPDFVEKQLEEGRIDCASMSRQLLADPQWPKKTEEDQAGQIRRCIRCNRKCLDGLMAHKGTHCIFEKEQVPQGDGLKRGD